MKNSNGSNQITQFFVSNSPGISIFEHLLIMKKTLPHYLLVAVFLSLSVSSFSQRFKSAILQHDTVSAAGKIVLNDGTERSGRIVFNDNAGVFTLTVNDEFHSFNSREILKAEFYDRHAIRHRLFYSLEYTDPETGMKDTEIFEVLKQLDAFAVLVKIQRLHTEAMKSLLLPRTAPAMVAQNSRQFTQTQTVFFVSEQGDFEPYLNIVEKEVSGRFWDNNTTNTDMIDASLFRKYTGQHFKALVDYAKQNSLSFKSKADIITILEHYEEIAGK